jgi:hypothetical protein
VVRIVSAFEESRCVLGGDLSFAQMFHMQPVLLVLERFAGRP